MQHTINGTSIQRVNQDQLAECRPGIPRGAITQAGGAHGEQYSVASCAMRLTLLTFDLLLRVCFFNLQRENVTSVKLNMKILLRIFCSVVGDDFLVSSGTRAFQEKPLDDKRRTGQWRVSVQVMNLCYALSGNCTHTFCT